MNGCNCILGWTSSMPISFPVGMHSFNDDSWSWYQVWH
jgi:hypothetical protein